MYQQHQYLWLRKNIYEKISRDDANLKNILKHFKIDEAVEYLNSIGISSKAIQFDTYNIDEECYDSEDIILIESILSGEKICILCLPVYEDVIFGEDEDDFIRPIEYYNYSYIPTIVVKNHYELLSKAKNNACSLV